MRDEKILARWAGVCLLGALAGLIATLNILPSFDARGEYFAEWFPRLVEGRSRFGIALVLMAITGFFVAVAGLALSGTLRGTGPSGAIPGFVLAAAGGGFLLSAILGIPAYRILVEASRSPETSWLTFAGAALPWAASNQAVLILVGLGGFATGLVATAIAIIRAGGLSRRAVISLGLAPLIPLAVFLAIPGEDPLIWLGVGLPSLVWCVGLGVYLVATGRVTR